MASEAEARAGTDGLLRIEYMPLAELLKKRDEGNPKDHDIGELDGSMKRWGYTAPVTMDEKTEKLVAGHGRLETLEGRRERGEDAPARIDVREDDWYVPVIRGLDFDNAAEARAYLVADNRLVELGGWDDPLLVSALKSTLEETGTLEGTGYDESEYDTMAKALEEPVGPSDFRQFDEGLHTSHTCPKCGYEWNSR